MISLRSGCRWLPVSVLAAVLVAAIFLYPLLLAPRIPLLDPDEGLHASIAQEMVERGDWVVPRLLGKPFLDKPILYFWAEAASLRTLGMTEGAVRLPGLAFGLLGVLTTAAVGWRLLGRNAGLIAGLFYTTMVFPAALAQVPAHDVALVPWVNLALLFFWEADRATTRSVALACTAAAGMVLGLAILTKGLAGVALTGVAYGGYLLATRRLSVAACLRGSGALAIAATIGATWYLAVERQNPGYLHYYFVERHLLGFATASQPHGGAPWWFYLPILLIGGLPWISYLPVVVQDVWQSSKHRLAVRSPGFSRNSPGEPPNGGTTNVDTESTGHPLALLLAWLVGGTMFLSLSHSKLITYIWPLLPAVAILASAGWARLIEGRLGDSARRAMARIVWSTCLLGPLALPITLGVSQRVLGLRYSGAVWMAAAIVSAAAVLPLAAWIAGRFRTTLSLATLAITAQFVLVMTCALPQVATALSARDLAEHFNRAGRFPAQLLIAEERIGSFIFYLRPDLRAGLTGDQLVSQSTDDPLPRPRRGGEQILALSERHAPQALDAFELRGVSFERAGRYRLYHSAEILASRADGTRLR